MDFKKIWSGVQFAKIGLSSKAISVINPDLGRSYLIRSLSEMPGIPAKMGQLFTSKYGIKDVIQPKAMPLETVRRILGEDSPRLAEKIIRIEEVAHPASLGQVHRVELDDGSEAAIKVQYPGVRTEVLSQLDIMLSGFETVGFSKNYGFDTVAYREFLSGNFKQELDYRLEAKKQDEIFGLWSSDLDVVVPKPDLTYSSANVLLQTFESSESTEIVAESYDKETKIRMAKLLAKAFLKSVLTVKRIQTDMHTGNYGFRPIEGQIVLYDFGSTIDITSHHAQILAYFSNSSGKFSSSKKAFDALVALGFDPKLLIHLGESLGSLVNLIFEPFETDPWTPKTWNLLDRMEKLLGSEKWWFRSAGPPWFLFLMRTAHGLMHALSLLDVDIDLRSLFLEILNENPVLGKPPLLLPISDSYEFKELNEGQRSKRLKVLVTESGTTLVEMTMPARAVEDLENLVSDETRLRIEADGYDLEKIKKNALDSDLAPQTLFESALMEKKYRVWLE